MTAHVIPVADYYHQMSEGVFLGHQVIHKFGRNKAVSTTYVPVSIGGIYRTPQVAGATKVRVKAGNINDTANGSGARSIYIEGIDSTGALASETLTTNGASAGTVSTNTYMRIYRAYVASSGTYATQSAGSHAGDIVIENNAGTEDWLIIDSVNFPKGQSEIGIYTVPAGYNAHVKNIYIHVEASKPATVLLYQRTNIMATAAPYDAARVVYAANGVDGSVSIERETLLGPFPEYTDIGFLARVTSTTASVSINFDIILDNNT